MRRSYPRPSVVSQADVVGLLSVGSRAEPREDILKLGEAGSKQLVEVRQEGEKGLATFFRKDKAAARRVLLPDGLPPTPPGLAPKATGKRYEWCDEQAYESK